MVWWVLELGWKKCGGGRFWRGWKCPLTTRFYHLLPWPGEREPKTYSFPLLPCNAVQTFFSAQLYFSVLPIIIPEGEMAMLSGGNVLLPAVFIICQWPGGEGTNTYFYPLQCTAIPIPTSLPIPIAGLYHLQVTIRGNQNLLFYQMQFSISTLPCNCSGKDKSWMEKLHIGRYADHRISECTSASHGNGDRNVMSPPLPLIPILLSPDFLAGLTCTWLSRPYCEAPTPV